MYLDVHPDRVEGNGARHTLPLRQSLHRSDASMRALSALPALSLVDDHELYDGYPEIEPHVMRPWLHTCAQASSTPPTRRFACKIGKNPPSAGGTSFSFEVGPLSFFALDTRIARTRVRISEPHLTSEADLAAFERWARDLRAPGLLLVSQPLLSPKGSVIEPSYSAFKADYGRILSALRDAPFEIGVLAGDRHTRAVELDNRRRLVTEVVSHPLVRVPSFLKNLIHRVIGGEEDQEPEVLASGDGRRTADDVDIAWPPTSWARTRRTRSRCSMRGRRRRIRIEVEPSTTRPIAWHAARQIAAARARIALGCRVPRASACHGAPSAAEAVTCAPVRAALARSRHQWHRDHAGWRLPTSCRLRRTDRSRAAVVLSSK